MGFRKIIAIIDIEKLDAVEAELKKLDVPGLSVSFVKGYGEYKNFFNREWLTSSAKLDVFVLEETVDSVVEAIKGAARTGMKNDGVVAVLPVEQFHEISNGGSTPARE